ncbi:MAG: exosortase-associated EpsI family protein [Phycisphaeraceae bacterium]
MRIHAVLCVTLSLLVLGGAAMDRLNRPGPPKDAEAYHQRVQRAIMEMPDRMGPYQLRDREIPPAAFDLLRANEARARQLVGPDGRPAGTVLVVHCRDAHDLLGHYPPVCYPANGYRDAEPHEPVTFEIDGLRIDATQYTFRRGLPGQENELTVLNFMVMPTGAIHPDDHALERLAGNYAQRFYGAGQVQVIPRNGMSVEDRRAFYELVLRELKPIIETMGSAPVRDDQAS